MIDIHKFKPTIVYTIYIAATAEKVWEALSSAEFSRKYFFGNAVEVDLRVGGAYVLRQPDGGMRTAEETHRDIQRQLASGDRKARADARDL